MSMPVVRASYRGLPGRLREDGYDLPDNLTYDEWWQIGQTLQQMERSVQWWLGDWWNYGERRYGEMASQAARDHVADVTGHAYKTIKNAATVARKFEKSRRRDNLSWSHHEAVTALPPEDAESILDEAASEGLSVFDVRDRARERKEAIRAEVTQRRSEPEPAVCAADDEPPAWVPMPDDLTEEASARMRFEMTMRGARDAASFGAGWCAALAFVEALDCFKRD